MANLDLYNKVRTVPQEACKGFSNGSFSGTDINPMWRIKTLTEHFGVCGIGWYIDEVDRWTETVEGEQLVFVKIHLYIKDNGEWSKPIVGIGGNKTLQIFPAKNGRPETRRVSDESYKMAYTDAISVACKALGFGGDIYWQNDPTKYARYYNDTPQEQPQYQQAPPSDKLSGRGRKKATAPQEAPAQQPVQQHFDQTLQFALSQVGLIADVEGIRQFWGAWKGKLKPEEESQLVDALHSLPFYPKQ